MTTIPEQQAADTATKQRNTLGIVALIVAIVGFIFAVIPGALILGWVLLPISFILAIVSLVMKDKKRGAGLTALIISIVGTILGVIVFVGVVGSSFEEAFSEETQVQTPENSQEAEATMDETAEPVDAAPADTDQGTRDNPLAIGSTITTDEWELTVNSVNLDAAAELAGGNMFNEPPAEGNVQILINVTATYMGSDPEGATPWASVKYVSPSGNTFDSTDTFLVAENSLDRMKTLYEGASTTGDVALEVPSDGLIEGTLRVSPDLFADDKFFAMQ